MFFTITYFPPDFARLEESAKPILWVYLLLMVSLFIMTALIWRKYKEIKSKPAYYLALEFSIMTLLMVVLFLGYLDAYITGFKRQIYIISFVIGLGGLPVANIFLVLFAFTIFATDEEQKYKRKYVLVCIFNLILDIMPFNFYGWPDKYIPSNLRIFRSISSGLLMLVSVFIYIRIFTRSMKTARKAEEKWAKMGLKFIAYSQMSMIFYFLFVLADTLYFTFTEVTGYSIFIYLAWISALFMFIFQYIGFIMPKWFKKRFMAEKE